MKMYRGVVLPVMASAGVFDVSRIVQRHKALVLMYHGVAPTGSAESTPINMNHVSADAFEWQVEFLRQHYTIVPVEAILSRLRSRSSVAGLAAITFDDGYVNVYENAAPILRRFGLPATVFLIAGLVGTNMLTWYDSVEFSLLTAACHEIECDGVAFSLADNRREAIRAVKMRLKTLHPDRRDRAVTALSTRFADQRSEPPHHFRLMNWSQVLELQRSGISFGIHAYSHSNLSSLPPALLTREIEDATAIVASKLGVPRNRLCFAYPDGDFNDLIRDRTRAAGLLGAVAVGNDLVDADTDPFAVPRVGVYRYQSRAMFRDVTVGFTRRLKRSIYLSARPDASGGVLRP